VRVKPSGPGSARVSLVFVAHVTRLPFTRVTDASGRLLTSLSPFQPARSYPSMPEAPTQFVPLDADEGTKTAKAPLSVAIRPLALKAIFCTGSGFSSDWTLLTAPDGPMEFRYTADPSYAIVATVLPAELNQARVGAAETVPPADRRKHAR